MQRVRFVAKNEPHARLNSNNTRVSMDRSNTTQQPLTLDSPLDEDRIRRALGLKTNGTHQQRPEQARQRHRFVSDGAVPVVVLNRGEGEGGGGLKERVTA